MSFIEARSDISICNAALSLISQQPLQGSLDDPANLNKHAGRECKLWYKRIVRGVLTAHHWNLATKTAPLVTTTNTRDGEWAYAYVAPSDMAFPVLINPTVSSGGVISYYRGIGYLLASLYGQPLFRLQNGTIFAQTADGILEYVSFDLTEQDFTDELENVIILSLAAPLARSVAKDRKLGDEYDDKATKAINRAIAHNLNMGGPRYGQNFSEAELVRSGYSPEVASLGYRL